MGTGSGLYTCGSKQDIKSMVGFRHPQSRNGEDATTIWTHAVKQDIGTYGRSFETVSEQDIAKGEMVL